MSSTSLISGKKPEVAIGLLSPASDIVVGPIEGVRLWRVSWINCRGWVVIFNGLHSMNLLKAKGRFAKWPPMRPMLAKCKLPEDQRLKMITSGHSHAITAAPHFDCVCGIYAYKMCSEVIHDLQNEITIQFTCLEIPFVAVGIVALWGRIVEHELGYRAQFAYPSRLALIFDRDSSCDPYGMARDISAAYGVPCSVVPSAYILQRTEWQEWHRIILGGEG